MPLAGTVFEIGYRGDMSIYKVRLADRSLMKVSRPMSAQRPCVNDRVGVLAGGRGVVVRGEAMRARLVSAPRPGRVAGGPAGG